MFSIKQKYKTPNFILKQIKNAETKVEFGIFPEIHKLFCTVDYKFFLWDYENEQDCFTFEGNSTIIKCKLLKPKKNYFSNVDYLIALITPSEIKCLAYSAEVNEVYISDISCSLNVLILDLCTFNDKILLAAKDGLVYELVYEKEESWFYRKCWLNSISFSYLPSFLQSFKSCLIKIVSDTLNLNFYTLAENGDLCVYGQDLGFIGKVNALAELKGYYRQVQFDENLKIIDLFYQKNEKSVAALSNKGHVIIFNEKLRIKNIFFKSEMFVDIGYVQEGVMVMAGCSLEGENLIKFNNNTFPCDKVWDIAEITENIMDGEMCYNDFTLALYGKERKFFVFTSLGLELYVKQSILKQKLSGDDYGVALLVTMTDPLASSLAKQHSSSEFMKMPVDLQNNCINQFVDYLHLSVPINQINSELILARLDVFSKVFPKYRPLYNLYGIGMMLESDLVFSTMQEEILDQLISNHIEGMIQRGERIDSMLMKLKEYGKSSVEVFFGWDLLNRRDKESVKWFNELSIDDLEKVGNIYAEMGFHEGTAKVALSSASKAVLNTRHLYYSYLINYIANYELFDFDSEFYKVIFGFKDGIFLDHLYRLLFDISKLHHLLQKNPFHLKEFIEKRVYEDAAYGLYYCVLLKHLGDEEAIVRLYEFATSDTFPATLEKRIEMLIMLQSMLKLKASNKINLQEVADLLDVANLQWDMKLNINTLLGVSELYEIAKRRGMFVDMLRILLVCEFRDEGVIREVWQNIIDNNQVLECFKFIGTFVFPVKDIVYMMEQSGVDSSILSGKVELFSVYDEILEETFKVGLCRKMIKEAKTESDLGRLIYWKGVLKGMKSDDYDVEVALEEIEELVGK